MAEGAAFVHSNPVSEAGFTMIPNAVVLDERLSMQAKLVYGYLKHLCWRGHSETAEAPLAVLERVFNISNVSARKYINELAEVGLVEVDGNRGLGRPNRYTIHDPEALPSKPSNIAGQQRRIFEAATQDSRSLVRASGALDFKGDVDVEPREDQNPALTRGADPPQPKVYLDENGQQPDFNALRDICGIDPKSPRCKEVAAAMNGSRGEPGIRALFWEECIRWMRERGQDPSAWPPDTFAHALAQQVVVKAETFRDSCEIALTPSVLRKYWFEPDGLAKRAAPGKARGASADEVREAIERDQLGGGALRAISRFGDTLERLN